MESRSGMNRHNVRAVGTTLAILSSLLLAGCLGGGAKNDTFALTGIADASGPSARNRQILIPEPTALKALNSEDVVIRLDGAEIQYLDQSP